MIIKKREKISSDITSLNDLADKTIDMAKKMKDLKEIEEEIKQPVKIERKEADFTKVISTGSTLLDLIISGGRRRGGGVPGGVVVEVYGPPGSGKTAVLSEMSASVQINGGDVEFEDPEGRLDKEYTRIYGLNLNKENYHMPDTVTQVFDDIYKWKPKPKEKGAINLVATDSLAALSTDLELESGDKMGMRRAKEFSEGFRKLARKITMNNYIIACSNQMRDSQYGDSTPGGQAIKFYASLRISVKQVNKVEKKASLGEKDIKKVIGIESKCLVVKSSIDDPYRECKIFIVFHHGIDDIRGNLQYMKDMTNATSYKCPDGEAYKAVETAIRHIENNDLEEDLRNQVIDKWEEVEKKLEVTRKEKKRR